MDEFRAKLCGEEPGDFTGMVETTPPPEKITDVIILDEILRDLRRKVVLHVGHGTSQLDDRIFIKEKLFQVRDATPGAQLFCVFGTL